MASHKEHLEKICHDLGNSSVRIKALESALERERELFWRLNGAKEILEVVGQKSIADVPMENGESVEPNEALEPKVVEASFTRRAMTDRLNDRPALDCELSELGFLIDQGHPIESWVDHVTLKTHFKQTIPGE